MGDLKDLENSIRERARELLEEHKVELVIGYEEKGGRISPCFIFKKDDTKRLVFNERAFNNLAVYLKKIKKKVGIVAKGCDIKSIIGLIAENQLKREDVVIIAISCKGLDLPKCSYCDVYNPSFYDILIGKPIEKKEIKDKFSGIKEIEQKNPKERFDYFKNEIKRCIRCYACRAICPFCYCELCIVDTNMPQWIEGGNDPSSNMFFHMIRALHLAGRCVGCFECERVCPMKIPLSLLNLKIQKDVYELFGYKGGYDPNLKPCLQEFKKDDYNEFIG